MFKSIGLAIRGQPLIDAIRLIFFGRAFYIALAIYGVATLLWVWILSRVPLSQAYPWVAGGIALVSLLSWYVFGERFGGLFWLGIGLIVMGIVITQCAQTVG